MNNSVIRETRKSFPNIKTDLLDRLAKTAEMLSSGETFVGQTHEKPENKLAA